MAETRDDAPGDHPTADRTDPFVLPPSTTSQFLLLIVLTLVSAAYTYDQLIGGPGYWEKRYNGCTAAADTATTLLPAPAVTQLYVTCFDAANLLRAGTALAVMAGVGTLVLLAALLHPVLVTRRQGLFALGAVDLPAATSEEIEACLAGAALRRRPTMLVEPFRSHRGGRAFGSLPRIRVRLSLALLRDTDEDRRTLRAILRHELAHIRNHDVGITSGVVVVPYVFVVAVALPLVVLSAIAYPAFLAGFAWRLATLLAAILLIRATVFRAREHHADVRASLTTRDGEERFAEDAFEDPPAPDTRAGRLRNLAGTWTRAHPSTPSRAAVVDHPAALLTAPFAQQVAAGLTSSVTFCYVRNSVIGFVQGSPQYASLLSGITVGLLVTTVTGFAMWRAALAAAVTGAPVPRGVRAGVGLAVGLLAGELLVPAGTNAWPPLVATHPATGAIAAVVLVLGCSVFTRWSASTATTWLAASRARSLRTPIRWSVVLGALGFGSMYGLWFNAVSSVSAQGGTLQFLSNLIPASGFVLVPFITAVGFPLAAAARSRGPWSCPRRLLLGDAEPLRLPVSRTRPALFLGPPLVISAALVLVDFTVTHGLLATVLFPGKALAQVSAVTLNDVLVMLVTFLVVELLIVIVVGALCGPRQVRSTFAHPLVAGTLTGALLATALMAYPTVVCGSACMNVAFASGVGGFYIVTTLVALATAVVAWGIVALVALARQGWSSRSRPGPAPERPRRPRRAAFLTAAMGVAAIVFIVPVVVSTLASANVLPQGHNAVSPAVANAPVGTAPPTQYQGCQDYLAVLQKPAYLNPSLLDDTAVAHLGAAREIERSNGSALRAVGTTMEQAILTGDPALLALTDRALYPICIRVPYGT